MQWNAKPLLVLWFHLHQLTIEDQDPLEKLIIDNQAPNVWWFKLPDTAIVCFWNIYIKHFGYSCYKSYNIIKHNRRTLWSWFYTILQVYINSRNSSFFKLVQLARFPNNVLLGSWLLFISIDNRYFPFYTKINIVIIRYNRIRYSGCGQHHWYGISSGCVFNCHHILPQNRNS